MSEKLEKGTGEAKKPRKTTKKTAKEPIQAKFTLKKDLKMEDLVAVRDVLEKRLSATHTDFVAPKDTIQIDDLPIDETLQRIDEILKKLVEETKIYGRPTFEVPIRSAQNIIWDERSGHYFTWPKSLV